MNIKIFGLLGTVATALFIGRLGLPAVAIQHETARNTYIIAPSLDIAHAYYAVALSAIAKSKEAHDELSKAKKLGDRLLPFADRVR